MNLYYASVGRNCNLLLNVPPDTRGLLHENDVRSLVGFRELREKEFATELAKGKSASSPASRGRNFRASNAVDGNPETYWSTDDDQTTGEIIIDLGEEMEVNRVLIQEFIRLGQRVREFKVDVLLNDGWSTVVEGTTIGYKVIRKFPVVKTSKVRLSILGSKACPVISNIELFRAPGE
jgi:alpha-L-fucosidase